jgi:hypothetical protein
MRLLSRCLRGMASPAPLLFAIAILSTACGGDPPPADLDTPIENDDVWVHFNIYPTANIVDDSREYSAIIFFSKADGGSYEGEFNDANTWINGVKMVYADVDFFEIPEDGGPYLKTGQSVDIRIEHELIGTIIKIMTVPAPISAFSLSPPLMQGVANTVDSYTMSWEDQGCAAYSAKLVGYNSDRRVQLISLPNTTSLSYTWSQDKFYDVMDILFPYLRFYLYTSDRVYLETLSADSFIQLDAPTAPSISNL